MRLSGFFADAFGSRRNHATLKVVIAAFFSLTLLASSGSAQERRGLTLDGIILLMRAGTSSARVSQLIEKHGVAFELDEEALRRLRENQASEAVLSAVKKMAAQYAEEQQRQRREAAAKAEQERQEKEAKATAERERREREAAAKAERERQQKEAAAKAEQERQEKEAKATAERERREREAAAKAERERQQKEAAAKAEQERQEKEAKATAERERREREAAAKAERERQQKEAAAKAEQERQEKEAKATAERERREREAAAKAERERQQKEAAAKAEQERQGKEAKARVDRERREKEAAAKGDSQIASLRPGETPTPLSRAELKHLSIIVIKRDLKIEERMDLTVKGQYSDGTEVNLKSGVQWKSSDPSVASVNTKGEVQALKQGSTRISATYQGVSSGPYTFNVNADEESRKAQPSGEEIKDLRRRLLR